ncbi:MAG: GNAT family N-acetyltransferase [Nocardioides sp.]
MTSGVDIRETEVRDRQAILELVAAAFAVGGADGSAERRIVEQVWARDAVAPGMDLVAVADEAIVGHVLGSWGSLAGEPVVGLAPLAVVAGCRGGGIGSGLVEALLRRAETDGHQWVVVLGAPAYYGRFGFQPAGSLGLSYGPTGGGNPHFQVRRTSATAAGPAGDYVYSWELPSPHRQIRSSPPGRMS